LTLTTTPLIVRAPVREKGDVLAGTDTTTVPFPVPLDPLVIVSQLVLVPAVQPQVPPAVTVKFVDPPLAATVLLSGDTLGLHVETPLCVMLTVWPATVRVPERGDVEVFAAAV
jgi:hypothetical protein